jgi:hypothetical protein
MPFMLTLVLYTAIELMCVNVPYKYISSCDVYSYRINIRKCLMLTASVVYCSEFLATDPEARVRFPALPKKK